MIELEQKLSVFKLEPQSKEQSLANIKQLRRDLHLEGVSTNKEHIRSILKKVGSLTDELLAIREQDRE